MGKDNLLNNTALKFSLENGDQAVLQIFKNQVEEAIEALKGFDGNQIIAEDFIQSLKGYYGLIGQEKAPFYFCTTGKHYVVDGKEHGRNEVGMCAKCYDKSIIK